MLPPAIGAFVGREHHLAELDRVLRRRPRTVSTVVISASPGIGKTSLAVHWAHRVRREFPDGQLYVDLRGHTAAQPLRTHEALARLLFGLGVAPNRVPFNTTDAAALYRTRLADRRMLVVLDNARDAEQVRPLLPPGEACFAVVTSRSDMRGLVARDGALPLGLDVLTPTESRDLLAAAIGEDRVAAEETAAADLAGLCAHLPLALRIAAASAETSIAKYVTLLAGGDRLAHLAIPGDEASAIRGAFAVSYQGLPEPARRLFRRLGLVPGQDFTVPAAAALDGIAPERAKELMAILLKGHLVESYLPGRYTFHDLLRDFAFGLCEPGEKDTAVERLFRWYTTHADAAACLLYPELVRLPSAARAPKLFDDAASATEWVTAEQHNIMAVATHAAENGPFEVAWRLADSSRSYLSTQGSTAEWLDLTTAGLRAAEVAGDTMGQAAACLGLGHIAIVTAERPKAVALYLRGLRLAGEAGWLEAQGAINNNLGTIYANMGRMEKAVGHHEQALVIIRRLGTLATEALTLGNLGGTYHRMGRLRHAAATLTEALAAMRRADSLGGQALQLNNLGIVQRELGELDASLDSLTESLSLYRRLGSVAGEAMVMCSLADLHRDAGRHGVALEYAQSALAVPELAGNTEHSAAAGNSLGAVHLAMGNPALALEACAAAVAAARTAGHPELIAESLVGKALALHGTGKSRRALAPASEAVRLARRTGFTILEAQALLALSRAEAVAGEADDARTHAAHAARLFQECGHKAGPHSLNAVRA